MQTTASAVTENQSRVLHEAILDLLLEAEASAVILCDRGGNIVTNTSWSEDTQVETVAALAAGSFAATQELATMTGETHFQSVAHEGDSSSIYIHSVAMQFLLVVQFGSATTLGLVKLYTDKTAQKAHALLSVLTHQSLAVAKMSDASFEFDAEAPVFELATKSET